MRVRDFRSLLFVPAIATRMFDKAHERGADAVIVDLEDSVPPDRKAEARGLAVTAIELLSSKGVRVMLRVNADADTAAADVEHIPLGLLTGILVPKVESAAHLVQFAATLAVLESRCGSAPVGIAALIETPLGVLRATEIAQASNRLCALGFGAEDYAAALGVAPEPAALAWPAQAVITNAHALGLACWGLAASVAVVDDMAAFESSVLSARAMGFTGTVCIHPRQVAIANRGFSPNDAEVAWARRVVEADAQALRMGQGAVLLDGRMIDRPIVERARRILAVAG